MFSGVLLGKVKGFHYRTAEPSILNGEVETPEKDSENDEKRFPLGAKKTLPDSGPEADQSIRIWPISQPVSQKKRAVFSLGFHEIAPRLFSALRRSTVSVHSRKLRTHGHKRE